MSQTSVVFFANTEKGHKKLCEILDYFVLMSYNVINMFFVKFYPIEIFKFSKYIYIKLKLLIVTYLVYI